MKKYFLVIHFLVLTVFQGCSTTPVCANRLNPETCPIHANYFDPMDRPHGREGQNR